MSEARPAFYALAPGSWRDYVTLAHPPYTLWHLSYVVIGATLAPRFDGALLGWTVLAFFLTLGVGAHALDELRGRPLQTRIPAATLVGLAIGSIGAAAAIGVVVAVRRDLWLLAFVAAGCALVVAYNLELFGGAVHGDLWFALGWGAFPLLTAYFAEAETIRGPALLGAVFAALSSHVQRILSTPVRDLRRRTRRVSGEIERSDGTTVLLDAATLVRTPERALRLLTVAVISLALALVVLRVT